MPKLIEKILARKASVAAGLAAAGLGVAAARWVDDALWGFAVALAAAVILAVPVAFLGRLGRGDVRTCLLTLLAVASLAQAAGPDLWRFLTSS
ncbi:MAG: hypothetical protein AAF657_05475, partial [Acidobacteriota bacterium]